MYASGMCHNCYINRYNKVIDDDIKIRRQQQRPEDEFEDFQINEKEIDIVEDKQ